MFTRESGRGHAPTGILYPRVGGDDEVELTGVLILVLLLFIPMEMYDRFRQHRIDRGLRARIELMVW